MAKTLASPDQQIIDRKRAIAMALQQASMQPLQPPSVRGAVVSPLEGVNKIAQALMAGYQNNQLDQQQAGLTAQNDRQRLAQALSISNAVTPPPQGLPAAMAQPQEAAIPGENAVAPVSTPPVMTQLPVGPGQVQGRDNSVSALAQALSSNDPNMAAMGKLMAENQMKLEDERRARAAQAAQSAATQQAEDARQVRSEQFTAGQNKLSREQPSYQFHEGGPGQAQGVFETKSGDFRQTGTTPIPDKTQSEYDKKVEDFNKQPDLVAKFGSGPTGYEKWLKSIPQASSSQEGTTVTVIDDPNHPGQQMPVVINKGAATGKIVTLDNGKTQATKTPAAQLAADVKEAEDYKTSAKSFTAMKDLASKKTYIADQAMGDQFFNIVKPGTGARMNAAQIDRFMTPGPLKDRMLVWAQKLDQGQSLTDVARKEMLDAAEAVVKSKAPQVQSGTTVKMKAPTGQVSDVPADQVEHFKSLGATVVK